MDMKLSGIAMADCSCIVVKVSALPPPHPSNTELVVTGDGIASHTLKMSCHKVNFEAFFVHIFFIFTDIRLSQIFIPKNHLSQQTSQLKVC